MRYAILHLSDLHRDLADEIENPALLESLTRDVGRYPHNQPPIPAPALAIVSGDLVYGVHAGHADPVGELGRQYQQAEAFLIGLADRFFGGDRSRVVILPGNHDVSFAQVMASLSGVDIPLNEVSRAKLIGNLWKPKTKHRWNWSKLSLHVINDQVAYERRLEQFATMYERFYEARRKFSLSTDEQFDVFDFPDIQFTCFTLNSCYQNDPFRRAGSVNPTCLARVSEKARQAEFAGRVLGAAWHHNLSGGPQQDDYLDSGILQFLIDAGITLGFHGHQHRSEYVDQRFVLDKRRRYMTVLSAGTLCSGPAGLPAGEARSYNVVEIDNDTFEARLHQRRMSNLDFTQPIWTHGYFPLSQDSYIAFTVCPPLTKRPSNLDDRLLLEHAEKLIRSGKSKEALHLLERLKDRPEARPFILEALVRANDDPLIKSFIDLPRDAAEAVLLGMALLNQGSPAEIDKFLSAEVVKADKDANIREVARKLRRRAKQ